MAINKSEYLMNSRNNKNQDLDLSRRKNIKINQPVFDASQYKKLYSEMIKQDENSKIGDETKLYSFITDDISDSVYENLISKLAFSIKRKFKRKVV